MSGEYLLVTNRYILSSALSLKRGATAVLDCDNDGRPNVTAGPLDKNILAVTARQPATLIVGDLRVPHEGRLGEILHDPKEVYVEGGTTLLIEGQSVTLKKRRTEIKGGRYHARGTVVVFQK